MVDRCSHKSFFTGKTFVAKNRSKDCSQRQTTASTIFRKKNKSDLYKCKTKFTTNQMTNFAIGRRDPMVEYSKLIECFCSINNLCSNFEVKFHHQQTILANPCMNFNKSMSYIQICMAVKSDIGFHFCKCTSEEGVIVLHSSKQ